MYTPSGTGSRTAASLAILAVIGVPALSACGEPAVQAKNYVTNGTFEANTIGWSPINGSLTRVAGHDGKYAARVTATRTGDTVLHLGTTSLGATAVGQQVTASAWVRTANPRLTAALRLTGSVGGTAAGSVATSTVLADTGWHQLSTAFTISRTNTVVDLRVTGAGTVAGHDIEVDTVTLTSTAAPKPTSTPTPVPPAPTPISTPPTPTTSPTPPSTTPPSTTPPSTTPPSTPPPTTPPPTGCSVGAKLTPSCGTLWGFYSPGNSFPANDVMATSVGRRFDIEKRYHDFSTASGTLFTPAEVARAQSGRLLHLTWDSVVWGAADPTMPATNAVDARGRKIYTWGYVASGALDRYIDAQAARAKALNMPVFMDFGHEMEIQSADFGTPADFVAAYRHVVGRFRAIGATKVTWAWVVSGWNTATSADAMYRSFYPGDDVVDWVGWDPYNHNATAWRSPLQTFQGFYNVLDRTGIGAGKPRMLGEYGVMADARTADWMKAIPAALKALPKLKAIQYFNSGSWAHFDPGTSASAGFAQAGHDTWVNPAH